MRHLWVRVLLPLNCILPFIFFFFIPNLISCTVMAKLDQGSQQKEEKKEKNPTTIPPAPCMNCFKYSLDLQTALHTLPPLPYCSMICYRSSPSPFFDFFLNFFFVVFIFCSSVYVAYLFYLLRYF